jgi:nicotinamidase-related amidase
MCEMATSNVLRLQWEKAQSRFLSCIKCSESKAAAQRAAAALKAGRAAGVPVVFSKVKFRPGYRDIADSNKAFALFKIKNLFPPDASKLISILQPGHDEIVVDKDRFCGFSGNDLKEVLRSGGIKHLVMAGVATSGVILSTFTLAADEDYSITILSDACADPKASLHEELMTCLFHSNQVSQASSSCRTLAPSTLLRTASMTTKVAYRCRPRKPIQ